MAELSVVASRILKSTPTSVYVHVPFCRTKCFYCDFTVHALGNKSRQGVDHLKKRYIDCIVNEVKMTLEVLKARGHTQKPLSTIYFGGGTPSLVSPSMLADVLNVLDKGYGIDSGAEITLEMDPGTFTETSARDYSSAGFNRASVGIQSFNNALLKKCNRSHSVQDARDAIEILSTSGFTNWSADLLSGLPGQTKTDWINSLASMLEMQPPHLSLYGLQIEPTTPFATMEKEGRLSLPSEDATVDMYTVACQIMKQHNYDHYENVSYAKDFTMRSRHNMVYWNNEPYYGFGVGATSHIFGGRHSRTKSLSKYLQWAKRLSTADIEQTLGSGRDTNTWRKDFLEDTILLSLRKSTGLDFNFIVKEFGIIRANAGLEVCERLHQLQIVDFITSTTNGLENHLPVVRLTEPKGFLMENVAIRTILREMMSD